MSSSYITISYHTISHVLLFYLFCWFDLHCILFYSILFYFISNWFDSSRFYSTWLNSILLRFTLLFIIVSHINEWFVSVCQSLYSSVCLLICMNKFFSFLSSLLFSLSFHFIFSHDRLPHTLTRAHKFIWINVPSYNSYIFLQKPVSEESYSSDCIISYLI